MIRSEINKIEKGTQERKINETKTCFIKINQIY